MLKRILIILASLASTALVVIGTIVLVAFARGYSYDFNAHRFVLNGLVILSSSPNGAVITQEGKDLRRKTPYRTTLEAGTYEFTVSKDGYRTWHKRLEIKASEVTFAEYVILLPNDIKTDQLAVTAPVLKTVPSIDHRQVAYITGGTDPALWTLNLDSRQIVKLYTPKPATPDAPAETLTDVTWSADNSHLLVQTALAGKPNFYVIQNSSSATPVDLTALFKFDFAQLKFNPSNWRELYWISPEGLRKLNVEQQTVSAVLADQVVSFDFGNDRVLFVQNTQHGRSLWSLDKGGHKQELVQSLAQSAGYELVYDNFRGRDILGVVTADTSTLTVYSDIFSATPVSKVVSKDADHALLSEDGRYFVHWSADHYGLYDVEKDEIHGAGQLPGAISQLQLFDGYHVAAIMGSDLYLGEYDGDNLAKLTGDASAVSAPFPTADQKRLISLRHSGTASGDQLYGTEIKR